MHNLFSPWKLLDFESESKIFFVLNIVFFHSWSPYVALSSNSNFKKINVFKITSLTCKQNQFLRRKVLKHSMNLIRFECANFRPVAINTSVFNKISFFMQIFERLTFSLSMSNSPIVLSAIIKNLLPSKKLSRIFHLMNIFLISSNAFDLFPSVFTHIISDSLQFCPSHPRGILCTAHPCPWLLS